ncbi:metal ABC transporter solute-binding protein, Zn/Mn family [Kineococcus sp. SYSU DK004]|uniref:metal ABC transporter solute-binding protein, Zn/Mn family n=1 Tax=Kineococcus sp. SYSU DK004 TaxID=3383125 RepID=UPI003D7D95B5
MPRPRTTRTTLPLALAGTLLLSACGGGTTTGQAGGTTGGSGDAAGPALSVVASTDVYGDIAAAVAGDAAEVTSIISGGNVDPHSYEGTTRDQLALSRADVVVKNGGGYDSFVDTMLEASGTGAVVVDAVEVSGLDTGEDEHAGDEHAGEEHAGEEHAGEHAHEDEHEGHDHGAFNEHVWYDLATVRAVAAAVEDALAQASPDDAETFAANARAFDEQVSALQERVEQEAAALGAPAVAVTEPVPLYLLEDLGAQDLTPAEFSRAVEEDSDAPVAVLQETLALFTGEQVRALVLNEQTESAQTDQVREAAEAAQVAVVPVTETLPEGEDYVSWMERNVDALVAALRA